MTNREIGNKSDDKPLETKVRINFDDPKQLNNIVFLLLKVL